MVVHWLSNIILLFNRYHGVNIKYMYPSSPTLLEWTGSVWPISIFPGKQREETFSCICFILCRSPVCYIICIVLHFIWKRANLVFEIRHLVSEGFQYRFFDFVVLFKLIVLLVIIKLFEHSIGKLICCYIYLMIKSKSSTSTDIWKMTHIV